ncbi:hypothetical protein [Acidicapsa acidisoli]|uniref:hypothetical protein n=1 Tax=Acidicapsa acidisoli TaxID=1615681 RepID=UPI0021E0F035|nr:hypothetical protein [Acidicapsa acidisoli]
MRHALALLCALSVTCAIAQQPAPITKSSLVANALATPATVKDLPVHQVVLYKNGIGYFEHSGAITGNQQVAIDFTSEQLNDVLQSLTALDSKDGKVSAVSYNSTMPIDQQLKTLALGLPDYPPTIAVYHALRGQRVEVTGAGTPLTGRLVNIEFRRETDKNGATSEDHHFLIVATDSGALRTAELTDSVSVRMIDPSLQKQFADYLGIIASTQNQQVRHLTLEDRGEGQRELRVSYISGVPVWKSTYRIVFPRDSTSNAILQGWAVVDNTIGSDWDNVQLSLVAGAPQSFIQPLSQPLYLRRPEIAISTTAMTTPQTHEAAEMNQMQVVPNMVKMGMDAAPPASVGVAGMQGIGSGSAGGVIGSLFSNAPPVTVSSGYGGNSGGGMRRIGSGVYDVTSALTQGDVNTNTFDDFFQYNLAQPVTIHKNESAMVPILQENLPAERVTLWSQSERTPFRAIWLENTSKLTFDRGSFSIFESGVFAGQGLLDPIHPGEKRLLSYAADQPIRVKQHPEEGKREIRSVSITTRGLVKKTYAAESRMTYDAINSAEDPRVVVIEVQRRPNRNLSPECKAAETAPSLYRFRLPVASHQTASLLFADEGPEYEYWQINEDIDQVVPLQRLSEEVPALQDKLKPLYSAQQSIIEMKARLHELEQKSTSLTSDETRARENLTALKGNDAAKRFVEELNQAEDNLQSTQKEIAALTEKEKAAVESLRQTLLTVDIAWNSPAATPAAQ